MSPNNSIVLENDSCDHLYLLVAALLSNTQLKTEFHEHIQLLHCSIDLPEPLDDSTEVLLLRQFSQTTYSIICIVRTLSGSRRKYLTIALSFRMVMA